MQTKLDYFKCIIKLNHSLNLLAEEKNYFKIIGFYPVRNLDEKSSIYFIQRKKKSLFFISNVIVLFNGIVSMKRWLIDTVFNAYLELS